MESAGIHHHVPFFCGRLPVDLVHRVPGGLWYSAGPWNEKGPSYIRWHFKNLSHVFKGIYNEHRDGPGYTYKWVEKAQSDTVHGS